MPRHQSIQSGGAPDVYVKLSFSAVKRLLALAIPFRASLALAGFLALASTGISLSLPVVAKNALDRTLISHRISDLDHLALALMALLLIGSVLNYAQFIIVARAGNLIVRGLRQRVFAHLLDLPIAYFDKTRSGDLASHLAADVSLLQTSLTDDLVRMVGNIVTLVGGIGLALFLDWKLCAVVVTLLGSIVSFFVVFGKRLRKMTRDSLDALSDAMGGMSEALSNVRLVKAFAREEHEEAKTDSRLEKVYRLSMRASKLEGAFGAIAFSGFILVLLGVVWYGGRAVLSGQTTAGSLLAFLMTVTIISGPMGSLAQQFARLQRSLGAAERIFTILDTETEAPDAPNAIDFPDGPGAISFRNLDFQYIENLPVLNDLSLDAPAGQITALVGASGQGKSTLASLLYRLYEPQAGSIEIDGVPIASIKRRSLRERIGLVPQEAILFNGSLRENILYGKLDATEEEFLSAARAANVEEFAQKLPEGYETTIGERGITLSGGQRQRVAIARAILKNPRILALDEATSALDTESEALVQEALDRLMRGRTTLIIAHRLSTIRDADQIAVIDGGTISELGRHEDLIRQSGRYSQLHRAGAIQQREATEGREIGVKPLHFGAARNG